MNTLRKQCLKVAKFIKSVVPPGLELPRGYTVVNIYDDTPASGIVDNLYLVFDYEGPDEYWVDGDGSIALWEEIEGFSNVPIPTDEQLYNFACDVEGGLLEEILMLVIELKFPV